MAWWEWLLLAIGSAYALWLVVWLLLVGVILSSVRRTF